MQYTVVLGTARINNVSQKVASTIYESLQSKSAAVELARVADCLQYGATVPPWGVGGADNTPSIWKEIVEKTDAFIFVLPEYNHSFPGEWKLLMDSLYTEYAGKTAYVVGVGGGQFAGARVMEHVMPVLVNFQFTVSPNRLHVGHVSKIFNESGEVIDEEFNKRLESFVEKVIL